MNWDEMVKAICDFIAENAVYDGAEMLNDYGYVPDADYLLGNAGDDFLKNLDSVMWQELSKYKAMVNKKVNESI